MPSAPKRHAIGAMSHSVPSTCHPRAIQAILDHSVPSEPFWVLSREPCAAKAHPPICTSHPFWGWVGLAILYAWFKRWTEARELHDQENQGRWADHDGNSKHDWLEWVKPRWIDYKPFYQPIRVVRPPAGATHDQNGKKLFVIRDLLASRQPIKVPGSQPIEAPWPEWEEVIAREQPAGGIIPISTTSAVPPLKGCESGRPPSNAMACPAPCSPPRPGTQEPAPMDWKAPPAALKGLIPERHFQGPRG